MTKTNDPKNVAKRKKPAVVGLDPVKTEPVNVSNVPVGIQAKGGRPSKYTPEIIEEIAERLSKGEPLAQICREERMPSVATMWNWERDIAGVSEAIARARDQGHDHMASECLAIADSLTQKTVFGGYDGGHIQEKKLRIETRLKLLAKWNPKKYGDKIEVDQKGEVKHVIKFTRG